MARAYYIVQEAPRRRLSQFGQLLWALVVREFKGSYRRSLLGPAWAVLQPMFYMVIFVFIRRMLNVSSKGVNDVLDTYAVMVPWSFFANAIARCGPSIYTNGGILKKVAMPREVFPAAGVATSLIDLLISSVILVAMMVWYGVGVGWALLWLPVLVLLTALLALGGGLIIAAVGTYKRDIVFGIPFLVQLWLLATPILYPLDRVPARLHSLYVLNPMVGVIEGFRNVLLYNAGPDVRLLGISFLVIAAVWLVAWPLFRSASQYFADVL